MKRRGAVLRTAQKFKGKGVDVQRFWRANFESIRAKIDRTMVSALRHVTLSEWRFATKLCKTSRFPNR